MTALHLIKAHVDGSARTETFQGKDYLVVPVVALIEGVIQGMAADGPELALADEFGRFPGGWNYRPVVMNHPLDEEGNPVSANSPSVLEEYAIGYIFNTRLSANGKALLMDAWIDQGLAEGLNTDSKSTLKALQAGDTIEVSTGYFAQMQNSSGEYEGEEYTAIQRNIVPDHLAFLPEGVIGACSNEDGCGARLNIRAFSKSMKTGKTVKPHDCGCGCGGKCGDKSMSENETTPVKELTAVQSNPGKGFAGVMSKIMKAFSAEGQPKKEFDLGTLVAQSIPDGMMDSDVRSLINDALSESVPYSYLIGFTNSKVIYGQYNPMEYEYNTMQQSYTVEGTKVVLSDDAESVKLLTQIVVQSSTEQSDETKISGNEAQNASVVIQPTDNQESTMTDKTEATGGNAATTQAPENPAANTEVTVKVEGVEPKVPSFDDLLANASPELRESIEQGVRLHSERKNELVKGLIATNRCKFDEKTLKAMSLNMLENLAELANVPKYDGRALPVSANADGGDEKVPAAPRLFAVNSGDKTDEQAA